MLELVGQAIAAAGFNAEPDAVVRDLRESISILELDGLVYEFAHRSFQEYFYARFVTIDRKLPLKKKVDWLIEGFVFDDTIGMISDMDRIYYEDDYLLPELRKLNRRIAFADAFVDPSTILGKFFDQVQAGAFSAEDIETGRKEIYYSHRSSRNVFFYNQAFRKYYKEIGEMVEAKFPIDNGEAQARVKILDDEFGGKLVVRASNDQKLLRVGVGQFAARIQATIKLLSEHLELTQTKRKRSLSSLLRKTYVG
jgi:hypothetical protein